MSETALALINRAYWLSEIVTKDFDTATSSQINEGLNYLNDILSEKTVDDSLNPYYQSYNFTAEQGVEQYFIENLIGATTVTFTLDTVRYSVMKTPRARYFGSARAENISSLPFMWHLERTFGGANLFLYYLPNEAYDFQIWGKFALASDVTLLQDLSLTFDRFYRSYLAFKLAQRLCLYFGEETPMGVENQISELELIMKNQISPSDFTMQKTSTLSSDSALNYGAVNLTPNGWFPSGVP